MNTKEKAKELVDKFYDIEYTDWDGYPQSLLYVAAKKCALIAVDELFNECIRTSLREHGVDSVDYGQSYWQEVKNEIEKS